MKVALDTNGLYTTRAGVARYLLGLMQGFREMGPSAPEIVPFAWPVFNLEYRQPARALKTAWRELVWANTAAPFRMLRLRPDVLHFACSGVFRHHALPTVATIHDVTALRFPAKFRPWQRLSAPHRLRRLAAADRIVCVSRFTADESVRLLGADPARIHVVYEGSVFADPREVSERPPEFNLPPSFFLFVGSLEPGKNLALLRETYVLAAARGVALPPLVIIGARWEGVAMEGAPPRGWIYAGRLDDDVLAYCYRRAEALLFPSLYEGFGLPVLEAMSLGCPVICAPVASLPEVGGNAPRYADLTPEAWLEAAQELMRDAAGRRQRIEEGRRQAARFSWKRCAEETAEAYAAAVRAKR